jgi:hypothetical protein
MTLCKLANNKKTAAKMIEAEGTISTSAHQCFGKEEMKREVEGKINCLKEREKRAEEEATN